MRHLLIISLLTILTGCTTWPTGPATPVSHATQQAEHDARYEQMMRWQRNTMRQAGHDPGPITHRQHMCSAGNMGFC